MKAAIAVLPYQLHLWSMIRQQPRRYCSLTVRQAVAETRDALKSALETSVTAKVRISGKMTTILRTVKGDLEVLHSGGVFVRFRRVKDER